MLDEATLKLLSRKEIQKLAKVSSCGSYLYNYHSFIFSQANGIKANLKTTDIVELLIEHSKTSMMNGSFV